MIFFFFFQAEDGIRDLTVTGVQTCALPISLLPPLEQPSGQPRAWRMSVTSAVRKQGVGRQGLQPCTCCEPKQQQQPKQKRVSCGMAGGGPVRGGPWVHPWGAGRPLPAAHRPGPPHPPPPPPPPFPPSSRTALG